MPRMRQRLRTLTEPSANLFRAQRSSEPNLSLSSFSFSSKSNHAHFTQNQQDNDDEEKKNSTAERNSNSTRAEASTFSPTHESSTPSSRELRSCPQIPCSRSGPAPVTSPVWLLESAKRVVSVEVDGRMVDALQKHVEKLGLQDMLTINAEDVLMAQLPQFDLCVANIPYGIIFSNPSKASLRANQALLPECSTPTHHWDIKDEGI